MKHYVSLDDAVAALLADPLGSSPVPLACLVAAIRPRRIQDTDSAVHTLRSLTLLLDQQDATREGVRSYLMGLLGQRRLIHLLADSGILSNEGMGLALRNRLGAKLLPPEYRDEYMKDVVDYAFARSDDFIWVAAVPDEIWLDLLRALRIDEGLHEKEARNARLELIEAIQVLSYRVSAIGLEYELVRSYPAIERFESPFLTQNVAVREYLEHYKAWMVDPTVSMQDDRHVRVLLDQCDEIVARIRKNAGREGVSVSLTYLLVRLRQHVDRLRQLLDLANREECDAAPRRLVVLFKALVTAENRKTSLRDLLATNTDLLALQITQHAGRTGEHYIASDRKEWQAMAKSAMGAGFLVGFMALFKILLAKLKLPPLIEAFAFSMNYSLGFMLVHVLHYTIATKQPAMTAASIAASIERHEQGHDELDGLAELIETVARTQFVAIMGNVLLAIPTALVIALGVKYGLGQTWVTPDKAVHLLHDLDPIHSLAIPHAAIAGCCLFLAGLISGYYDNKAVYNRIPARLMQLRWPQRILGAARWQRVCAYIENNLGALAGNFFFGIMLGSIGTLGFLLGLPIDIRHITFSSANLAYAAVALDFHLDWQTWLLSVCGIGLIGLTNLAVSFSLALFVALRARRSNFGNFRALVGKVVRRFLAAPQRFFIAPRDEAPALVPTDH
ncbi:MAG: site-specific recombinase [Burkholderiales bacterium]|nr:site-specific recombinase [Burkholderiales bacterium]